MARLSIPVAPTVEQRRIVTKLDGLLGRTARARKELDRVPALVERYREAILERNFLGLAEGGTRFAPLSELVDGERGIPYGIVQTGKYFVDGVPTVRAGDIKRFRIARETLKRVEPTIAAEYKRTVLRGGEVLVSIRGTVGNVAVAHTELAGCNISREVALIPPLGDIDANFLMFFIASPNVQRFLKRHTKGVAQSGVNLEDLRQLPTPVLSMEDQHEIVRRIESAFAWLDKLTAEHNRAAALLPKLEQALLAKAFRGELVPQDPNDEPASLLLERIRAARAVAPERKRKPRSSDVPRAPRQRAAMTKSRLDQDVMHQPYLAKHLRDAGGSAKVEDLFRSADLPVTDFYKQLAWEVDAGHVNDKGALLEAA
jgi:type I restriction enzyme S subunit